MPATPYLTAAGSVLVASAAVALSLGAAERAWERLAVAATAFVMVGGAAVLMRDARRGRLRFLGGELIVDAAFAHVVVVLASRPAGAPMRAAEFVAGLTALALGTAAMAQVPLRHDAFAGAVRRSVTIVSGTILAAVAVGQLEHPGRTVLWNWTPFLAFAVPGMLAVFGAEVGGLRSTSLAWGVVRAAGVAVLLYGSVNNLGLGAGGWGAGVGAGGSTLAIWLACAGLLAAEPLVARHRSEATGVLLATAGIVGMVASERAAILRDGVPLGRPDAAASLAWALAASALGLLVLGRAVGYSISHSGIGVRRGSMAVRPGGAPAPPRSAATPPW